MIGFFELKPWPTYLRFRGLMADRRCGIKYPRVMLSYSIEHKLILGA